MMTKVTFVSFFSRLIPYCQYSICTKFHVKWTKIFWDTAWFFTVGLLAPAPPFTLALRFSKKPSPGRVKLSRTNFIGCWHIFYFRTCFTLFILIFSGTTCKQNTNAQVFTNFLLRLLITQKSFTITCIVFLFLLLFSIFGRTSGSFFYLLDRLLLWAHVSSIVGRIREKLYDKCSFKCYSRLVWPVFVLWAYLRRTANLWWLNSCSLNIRLNCIAGKKYL